MPARRRSPPKKSPRRQLQGRPARVWLWTLALVAVGALGAAGVLVWSRSGDGKAALLNLGADRLYGDVQVSLGRAIAEALPGFSPGAVDAESGAADDLDWALPDAGVGAAIRCRVVPAPPGTSWWEVQAQLATAAAAVGGRVLWCERLARTGRNRDREAPDESRDLLRLDLGVPDVPTHTLLIFRPEAGRPTVRWGAQPGLDLWTRLGRLDGAPTVAVVIDDWGYGETAATRSLLALDAPLTLAVLPGLPFSRRYALEATDLALPRRQDVRRAGPSTSPEHLAATRRRAAGCPVTVGLGGELRNLPRRRREVLLHLPMEPQDYPRVDPGVRALMVGMASVEIDALLDRMLAALPGVTGVSNHMGSAATADTETMQILMDELRRRDLIFLDSLTTERSVAGAEAGRAGVPAARNRIFLDHDEPDAATVRRRLETLVRAARSAGFAVGIGHPHTITAEVLAAELPRLAAEGVRLVTVSELLALQAAASNPVP